MKETKTITRKLKAFWDSLDYVPDCPECKGTGDPSDYWNVITVWWKGKEVVVCARCSGSGKV